ncbi:MAG: molybdenum cofactor biosynthesis protein MoaE [Saprospiraceae bacterium]|nr:molybdenum cofactor biosynthesis protein MoaE [Saprospiraceae bacterium]MCB9319151.1 molybdenum cofactor biosynthesis protein MoaE [Lewinellaceae bacterium]
MEVQIHLTSQPLDTDGIYHFLQTPSSGGIVVFTGTVRDHHQDQQVIKLEFEAYEPMALKEMNQLAQICSEQWPCHRIAIHHRLGTLGIGEAPVIIGVSSAHRQEAFAACQFLIDSLKERVPIWKKEFFTDGSHWVSAHP